MSNLVTILYLIGAWFLVAGAFGLVSLRHPWARPVGVWMAQSPFRAVRRGWGVAGRSPLTALAVVAAVAIGIGWYTGWHRDAAFALRRNSGCDLQKEMLLANERRLEQEITAIKEAIASGRAIEQNIAKAARLIKERDGYREEIEALGACTVASTPATASAATLPTQTSPVPVSPAAVGENLPTPTEPKFWKQDEDTKEWVETRPTGKPEDEFYGTWKVLLPGNLELRTGIMLNAGDNFERLTVSGRVKNHPNDTHTSGPQGTYSIRDMLQTNGHLKAEHFYLSEPDDKFGAAIAKFGEYPGAAYYDIGSKGVVLEITQNGELILNWNRTQANEAYGSGSFELTFRITKR